MPWVPSLWRGPQTKRERKLAQAKTRERMREHAAQLEAQRLRAAQKKRDSWDRMKSDVARRVGT